MVHLRCDKDEQRLVNDAVSVTIGTFAHNEQINIRDNLECWLKQTLPSDTRIIEIIVVADGCTDLTVPIVKQIQESCPLVRLIEVQERRGITPLLNTILSEAKGDIIVLQPADTLPNTQVVARLAHRLKDPMIGAVVGKAEPNNDPRTLFGYAARLLYEWNYLPGIVQVDFEGGTAIRKGIVKAIPHMLVDNEAYVHKVVVDAGYQVVFEPLARTVNRGPDNIRDFLKQRRRNLLMHLQVRRIGATSPHSEIGVVLPLLLKEARSKPRRIPYLVMIGVLSGISYLGAILDLIAKRSHMKWQMIDSTKSITASARVQGT